ncbi:MAG: hypothetical protein J0H57_03885, partial [Rhodospirillales bacterium]|nr:hypothetical protein [Rhodospirillales bacterium]
IDALASEINAFVPLDTRSVQFRADLAGLLVVSIVATYESCVKETLTGFAGRHHAQFGTFAQNHFGRLNSRISLSDLYGYARTFDSARHAASGAILDRRKSKFKSWLGKTLPPHISRCWSGAMLLHTQEFVTLQLRKRSRHTD